MAVASPLTRPTSGPDESRIQTISRVLPYNADAPPRRAGRGGRARIWCDYEDRIGTVGITNPELGVNLKEKLTLAIGVSA